MLSFTHSCMQTYIHYWHQGEKTKANLLHCGILSGGGDKDQRGLLSRWHLWALGVGALMCRNKKAVSSFLPNRALRVRRPGRGVRKGFSYTLSDSTRILCRKKKKTCNMHLDHLNPKGMLMDIKHGRMSPFFCLDTQPILKMEFLWTIHSSIKVVLPTPDPLTSDHVFTVLMTIQKKVHICFNGRNAPFLSLKHSLPA